MSVTVQAIPQDPSPAGLNNVNKFYVPNILSFNLKKTPEDRLQAVEAGNPSSLQNGDPFLSPVEHTIESNKENPVLNALLRGNTSQGLSQWNGVSRTPINNCHPFKKTEFSHDLSGDDTPVQIPKSLTKRPSGMRRCRSQKSDRREKTLEAKTSVLKDIQLTSDLTVSSESGVSFTRGNRPAERQSPDRSSLERDSLELSIFNKRKKMAQSTIVAPKPRVQYVNSERLVQLRLIVDSAIKNHKVYSMTGCYTSVRNALKQRGWIEKIDNDVKGKRKINRYEEIGLCQGEAEIMNKMLKNVTEDLCWLSRPYPYYYWKDFDKFEMVNRLPRAYFSNKVGLCNSLQQMQWFYESGVCTTKFPRTYNMSTSDEIEAFKEDYRMTACIGTLKWFTNTYKNGGEKAVRSPDGKVEMNVIEFALRRCAEFVKTKQHEDIDILDTPNVWEYQWDQFITQYYRIINEGQILKDDREGVSIKAIFSNVQSMLNIIKPYWPQFDIEGHQNFWIVKPGGRCCGAGIVIKNNLEQILIIANPNSAKESRFIVQKYIERPLLIYNTKFDIRQWFLVTNVYPLTIWMYKESYLRFCSQPFTLKNTHESIHLCNNAVQRKYKNGKRDRGLPDENMWDCYTFQTYLKAIGQPDAWEKYIYPGMKEGFVGALLASQDSMERKKNCFELYGADFMISDTLTDGPWLIEINSNPAMDSSTSVTARLCPQVLEDIIKVVIDRRDNKSASTGAFEMVFRQNCPPIPSYLGISLCVKGKKAYRSSTDSRPMNKTSKTKKSSESVPYTDTEEESTAEEVVTDLESVPGIPQKVANVVAGEKSGKNQHSNAGKDTGIKRRKIDWVRKNIDDLKGFHTTKESKGWRWVPKNSSPVRENHNGVFREQIARKNIDDLKGLHTKKESKGFSVAENSSPVRENQQGVFSEQIARKNIDDLKGLHTTKESKGFSVAENSSPVQENQDGAFSEQILSLLGSVEVNQFVKELKNVAKEKQESAKTKSPSEIQRLIIERIENINKNASTLQECLGECEVSETLTKLLQMCRQKVDGETSELNLDFKGLGKTYGFLSKFSARSCPNFDSAFEKELQIQERQEEKVDKTKSGDSFETYFSVRSDSVSGSKTSLDYFRDWKSKLSETRKTCEDLLNQLHHFKEANSKVKFQEAVQKTIKDELDFVKRIKQRKKFKDRAKIIKEDRFFFERKEKSKCEDFRYKFWDDNTPLAINSENGAVRNISQTLPKIKQRSRPLLPNGSSEHGRKIDVALEQTCCH